MSEEISVQLKSGDNVCVSGKTYVVKELLGHGKGGYSYLVTCGGERYVLKKIHHEPCSYYTFGDKLQSELNDYNRLKKVGIPMPEPISFDREKEILIKQFIDGKTVEQLVKDGQLQKEHILQVENMCAKLYAENLNIDYYPTNFILSGGVLYYIDFECNVYSKEWDFEHWGKQYWVLP